MRTLWLVFICKLFQSRLQVAHLSRMAFPWSCSCQDDCGICYAYAVGYFAETLLSKIRRWKRQ